MDERNGSAKVIEGTLIPNGYEQITDLSVAISLTVPENSIQAIIVPENQDVRWRDDLVDPTASIGMPLKKDAVFICNGKFIQLKFIEVTAGAVLNISYYK